MQEEPHGERFIPEIIDEQIDQLRQSSAFNTADARLARDLESAYFLHNRNEEEQAIERIRERLIAKALPPR